MQIAGGKSHTIMSFSPHLKCVDILFSMEKNVLLVEDMKHNLLSVIQMCDQGHTLQSKSKK
jgi:hypothetical protein